MEKKTEVKVYQVDYICDKCGGGKVLYTGKVFPMNPPLYESKCKKCGEVYRMRKTYPMVVHEEIESQKKQPEKTEKVDWIFIEDGEANVYTILNGDKWIMTIQQNGEMLVEKQRKIMRVLCEALEKIKTEI
jgi:hypothetical protein